MSLFFYYWEVIGLSFILLIFWSQNMPLGLMPCLNSSQFESFFPKSSPLAKFTLHMKLEIEEKRILFFFFLPPLGRPLGN